MVIIDRKISRNAQIIPTILLNHLLLARVRSPVILITGIVSLSSFLALPHPHLLPHKVCLLLPLRLVWWSVQVTLVIDNLGMSESPCEHLCAELISVAEICEADDVTSSDRVLNHDHCRNRPDLQSVAKEWSLLSINLAELGFDMLLGQNG